MQWVPMLPARAPPHPHEPPGFRPPRLRDAVAFRAALNKAGGISRLQRAIEAIDVRFADASVESDRKLILNNIEESAGIDELNRLIRARLLIEFKRISAQSLA